MSCYCDYDHPIFFSTVTPIAKKAHRCGECGRGINPGERYEITSGSWERGTFSRHKVCGRCVAMRDWVQAHVPCLCWSFGNMVEDCIETSREHSHEAPGLLFGAYRRWMAA